MSAVSHLVYYFWSAQPGDHVVMSKISIAPLDAPESLSSLGRTRTPVNRRKVTQLAIFIPQCLLL